MTSLRATVWPSGAVRGAAVSLSPGEAAAAPFKLFSVDRRLTSTAVAHHRPHEMDDEGKQWTRLGDQTRSAA